MIYPQDISGPQFNESDLVEFVFEGATLTLSVPAIRNNTNSVDQVTSIRDFSQVDTQDWEVDSEGAHCFNLLTQKWTFEDTKTLDDIATCWVDISIVELPEELQNSHLALSKSRLKQYFLDALSNALDDIKDGENTSMDKADWPNKQNDYLYKCINRSELDWMQVQVSFVTDNLPSPLAYIPINSRFVLSASFHMSSLHYSDRENKYSDKLIREIEFSLFDEFLNSINLRYQPEVISLIKKAN